nr:MAG TPA: hypothetical protein [Caudoviricetes sp.]
MAGRVYRRFREVNRFESGIFFWQISNSLPTETFSILLNSYLIFWEVVARCCESAGSSPARLLWA